MQWAKQNREEKQPKKQMYTDYAIMDQSMHLFDNFGS